MKIVLWCLCFAVLFYVGPPANQSPEAFRIIPILKRENGYGNFKSIAFLSKNELDSFLKETSTQPGWNNRKEFEDALLNANVDFSKEALVLLRHTETSGSVQVTFQTPTLHGRNLVCEIEGTPIPPGHGGTADMAYYCFAVAVSKSHVSQVELRAVEGGFIARRLATIVFPIKP